MQSNSTNTQKTFSSTNNGDFVDLLGIPVNLKPAEQALNQTSKSTQLGLSKAPANYSKQNVVFDPFEDLFK